VSRDRGVVAALAVTGVLAVGAALAAAPAGAAVSHTVGPGDTLWSIAAANNLTTRTVATYNGLSEDAQVVVGQTVEVPSEVEGAAALASAGHVTGTAAGASPTSSGADSSVSASATYSLSAPGLGHIPSPWGALHLDPAAADAWNAMRDEAVSAYGVDLHPAGTQSAFRGHAEQAQFYEDYLSGIGAPAAPPGTSAHESGKAVDVASEEMRGVIDEIGWKYGWGHTEAPGEWWHLTYAGG
jgi:LysM repeat protein